MHRTLGIPAVIAAVCLAAAQGPPPPVRPPAVVTVTNPINMPRPSETIVLAAADVQRLLGVDDVRNVQVQDDASGSAIVSQALDLDQDGKFEQVIFQADLQPAQARRFVLRSGGRQALRASDFKAYGRFVRERYDDFAWENDRIAHRVYGAALETAVREPLTSSAVDVWTKRVRRLVINDWYMVDDYHRDNGTGGDFYSAGRSRGCGGTAIWSGGQLYPSANFRQSRVLANGPIRVSFELTYEAWDAAGQKVSEAKRVTLDAGHNLGRYESRFSVDGKPAPPLAYAVGIRKAAGSTSRTSAEQGTLSSWETFPGDAGHLGCGVVIPPAQLTGFAEADGNYLLIAQAPRGGAGVYYAGFGWDKSGDFADAAAWDRYLSEWARRLAAPVRVSVGGQ